MKGCVEGVVE